MVSTTYSKRKHLSESKNVTIQLKTWITNQIQNIFNICPHLTNATIYLHATIIVFFSIKKHKLTFLKPCV